MATKTTSPLRQQKSQLGQFLTPPAIADFMATLFGPLPRTVRLLDPGAGAGALTSAFIARCCRDTQVREIDATLYEIDSAILPRLEEALSGSRRLCEAAGVSLTVRVRTENFLTEVSDNLSQGLFRDESLSFDAAIVNPPYRKIRSGSAERRALRAVGIETSNLYTGFVGMIQRLLAPGGQVVGITPRSFCNGTYFRPFRTEFLEQLELRRLHLFDSRQAAFRHDKVLQENVIFHAFKGRTHHEQIVVSSSSGELDSEVIETLVPMSEIIHADDPERYIHIPSSSSHHAAKEIMAGLSSNLTDLGVSISTGRVVDFRLKEFLLPAPELDSAPLLYPGHFRHGTIVWPKENSRKPNAIRINHLTQSALIPQGCYLLMKRFTAKEERRRLVASLLEPAMLSADWIGVENHLNYFHTKGQGLNPLLARGLYVFLNSTMVDQYFRRFSGHTQVNATDLRALSYPRREVLQQLGKRVATLEMNQVEIDRLLFEYLDAC